MNCERHVLWMRESVLVSDLTVAQCASLIDYLESLGK